MRFAKTLMAVAACSLATAPALAAPASKLSLSSVSSVRSASSMDESSEAAGGFIIPLIAVIAIGLGIFVAVDEDSTPDSP